MKVAPGKLVETIIYVCKRSSSTGREISMTSLKEVQSFGVL